VTQGELGALISRCFGIFAGLKALWYLPALSSVFFLDGDQKILSAHTNALAFSALYMLLLIAAAVFFWFTPDIVGNRIFPEKNRKKKITAFSFEQSVVTVFIATGCLIFINTLPQLTKLLQLIFLKPVEIHSQMVFKSSVFQETALQAVIHMFIAVWFIAGAEGLKNTILKLRGRTAETQKIKREEKS